MGKEVFTYLVVLHLPLTALQHGHLGSAHHAVPGGEADGPARDVLHAPHHGAGLEGLEESPGIKPSLVPPAVAAGHHALGLEPGEQLLQLGGRHQLDVGPAPHLGLVVTFQDIVARLAGTIYFQEMLQNFTVLILSHLYFFHLLNLQKNKFPSEEQVAVRLKLHLEKATTIFIKIFVNPVTATQFYCSI